MTLLQCEICGGKLIMKPGGVCECCDCGMGYDKEWIKERVTKMRNGEKTEDIREPKNCSNTIPENDLNAETASRKGHLATIRSRVASVQHAIVTGDSTFGLRSNGTVLAVGDNAYGQCSVSDWRNIVSIVHGYKRTVGLRSDGTVVAVGGNNDGKCSVSDWKDIISIACSFNHTVGLRSDGTVVATGTNMTDECNMLNWTDIVAIVSSPSSTFGLRSNGTVLAVGDNAYGQCSVSDWRNIVSIACGYKHTLGLRSDGTVVGVGDNYDGKCNVSDWKDIISIACSFDHTVGLRSDGTVVATGTNMAGECNVSDWTDIVAIACGACHTVGLRSDGTVVAVGHNYEGRCNVSDWTDIIAIVCGSCNTVGLRSDGTVVAVGDNEYGQCNVGGWKLFTEGLDEFKNGEELQFNVDIECCKKDVDNLRKPPNENEDVLEREMGQMQHLRAVLLVKELVDRYCEQFNSSLRGKKEWDAAKEKYSIYSREFMCYFLARYAIERAKYKTYERYWRDYLAGKAAPTDVYSLITQATQSLDVRVVMGDISSGNFEEIAEEYKFPYTDCGGVDSSIFVHKYLNAVIKNELLLTYINELNTSDIFKELSVDEALTYMTFSTSDDFKGNVFMNIKKPGNSSSTKE